MDTEAKFVSWLRENAERRVCLDFSIPSLRSRTGLDLVAIHCHLRLKTRLYGNLCLGLRHPDNTGPTKQIAANVVDTIEQIFQETGMENDVIAQIHQSLSLSEAKD